MTVSDLSALPLMSVLLPDGNWCSMMTYRMIKNSDTVLYLKHYLSALQGRGMHCGRGSFKALCKASSTSTNALVAIDDLKQITAFTSTKTRPHLRRIAS